MAPVARHRGRCLFALGQQLCNSSFDWSRRVGDRCGWPPRERARCSQYVQALLGCAKRTRGPTKSQQGARELAGEVPERAARNAIIWLICSSVDAGGLPLVRLGVPLLDEYLAFVAGRCRPFRLHPGRRQPHHRGVRCRDLLSGHRDPPEMQLGATPFLPIACSTKLAHGLGGPDLAQGWAQKLT
jgi:hypothetical protein